MNCDCCNTHIQAGHKQMHTIGNKWMVCSNCFFNKTEDALIDILQKKAPVTRLSLQDEYQVHSGKPAVQSGAINPDYMLWLEATVQNLRNITKSTSY